MDLFTLVLSEMHCIHDSKANGIYSEGDVKIIYKKKLYEFHIVERRKKLAGRLFYVHICNTEKYNKFWSKIDIWEC